MKYLDHQQLNLQNMIYVYMYRNVLFVGYIIIYIIILALSPSIMCKLTRVKT